MFISSGSHWQLNAKQSGVGLLCKMRGQLPTETLSFSALLSTGVKILNKGILCLIYGYDFIHVPTVATHPMLYL